MHTRITTAVNELCADFKPNMIENNYKVKNLKVVTKTKIAATNTFIPHFDSGPFLPFEVLLKLGDHLFSFLEKPPFS